MSEDLASINGGWIELSVCESEKKEQKKCGLGFCFKLWVSKFQFAFLTHFSDVIRSLPSPSKEGMEEIDFFKKVN